ncbi:MAG: tetratricopeptide repeat protein [Verrucomicrobiaceae bacterium]
MKNLPALLCFVWMTGQLVAQTQEKKAPVPDPTSPPLPQVPVNMQDYENPLFQFRNMPGVPPIDLGQPGQPVPQIPFSPQTPDMKLPQARDPAMTAEQQRLMELAMKIAPSVVTIRVWDEFGGVIASGVGTFIHRRGLLLTDAGLLHPEIADRVDYITTTAADGTNHRIVGYYLADQRSGVALLQSDDVQVQALNLKTEENFSKERPCTVLAVSEKRGLVLADATVVRDGSLAGQGWLSVKGKDSPGAPGSPIINNQGDVIAVVALRVPLKNWLNFALPCDIAAAVLANDAMSDLKPLKELPTRPKLAEVTKDTAFLRAFQLLTENKVSSAVPKLLALTNRFPRSAECWSLLGLAATQLGAISEGVNCQRKAVALDPLSGLYWYEMAMGQLRRNATDTEDLAQSREALEQAVELRPTDKLAWLLLASRCLRNGDNKEADDALRQVIKLEPDYAPAYYLLAFTRSRAKDLQGSAAAIDRCLELDSSLADAWFFKGLLLDADKQSLVAAEAFRRAAKLNPKHPHAWMNSARAYLKAGRDTEARMAFREHEKRLAAK